MKVLVCDAISSDGLKNLKAIPNLEIDVQTDLPKAQLLQIIPNYEIVIVRSSTLIDRDVIEAGSRLALVARAGMGVDTIDVPAATEKGVIVMNTPAANSVSAAEHSFALILAMVRNVPQAHQDLKQGVWNRKKYTGTELAHKTLGLLGLGNVGRYVGQFAKAFQMKVIAFDPFITDQAAQQLGVERVELDELYKRSDILSIHAVLNEKTKHMVSKDAVSKMKKGIRICNCARAEILDTQAMVQGLESGVIAGLALDVFETEPVPSDHPLVKHPQVVVTPHLGASTKEAQDQVMESLVDQLRRYVEEDFILNGINVPAISHEKLQTLGPFLQLAHEMGNIMGQLFDETASSIHIGIKSKNVEEKDLLPISHSALAGFLKQQVSGRVNIVNAPLLAQERNIQWGRLSFEVESNYRHVIELHITFAGGEQHILKGTIGTQNTPRIVQFDAFELEVRAKGCMLWLKNEDLPGIVGKWGSILGQKNINISQVQVSSVPKDRVALAVMNIDSPAGEEVLQALRGIENVFEVKQVHL
ncbi:MAG: phosphoglycerate dehydrogenase [Bdellovibrionota bacterium]